VIPLPADEHGKCPDCGKTWKRQQLKYAGLLVHDLRRSGVRNLIRAGIQQSVANRISGHKTDAVFERYNIIDEADLADAARKLDERQKSNTPGFGHDLGIVAENSTKNESHEQMHLEAAVLTN
jgi:hypothetical protein